MENYYIGKTIKHISISIEKSINKVFAEKDLSATQAVVLVFLNKCENHSSTIKMIEKEFDKAQSTMFGIINRLEKKGFVNTYVDEKRNKFVCITEDGLKLSEYIKDCFEAVEENILSCLTSTEQLIFVEILKKIEENMK